MGWERDGLARGRVAPEVAGVAAVVAMTGLVFARFSTGPWSVHFLFGGDSLLMPLLLRSVAQGERLDWTFSSSTFFVPELLIYAVSDWVTPSTQWALIVNGFVNVLALYALLRLVLARVPEIMPMRAVLFAVAMVASLVACVVLERDGVPLTSTAFTFFYSTYYVGVTLVGLALLWLVVGAAPRPVRWVWVTAGAALTAACTASDPLVVTHVVVPLLLASFTARRVVAHRSQLPAAIDVTGVAVGVAGGLLLRATVMRGWISAGVGSYVAGPRQGLDRLTDLVSAQLDDPWQRIELFYLTALVLWAVGRPVWLSITGRGADLSPQALLVTDFAGWSTVCVLGSQLVTGTLLSRYMGVLLVYPLLSLTSARPRSQLVAGLRVASIGAVALLSIRGLTTTQHVTHLAARRPPGEACLINSVRSVGVDGVGHFWRVRAFDTHTTGTRVLQVNPDFTVFHWLNNAGAYDEREFGFVLVDLDTTSQSAGITADNALGMLGSPDSIDRCGAFEVWHYSPLNPGHVTLNQRIADST